ncbi:MAG: HD domain-containing protein [Acidobacteria bacterium]|nr:MAG: HD domain-containing protein [Acidobacteriota bacterium]
MDNLKQFFLRNFERILVFVILVVAFLGTLLVENTSVVLDFYFLPVLVAGYFLGKRSGLLAAVLSILLVLFSALLFPDRMFAATRIWHDTAAVCGWGGFLILTSVAVGSLYEVKERQLQDLKHAYIGVLEILSKYLESTDPYTKGHSVRVSELASAIAAEMRLSAAEIDNIRVAGLLHDIGKIEISGEVLRKAAVLSTGEQAYLESHAEKGARLLSSVGGVLKEVVPIVLAHHRYFVSKMESDATRSNTDTDSNSDTIPLGARIVAVADSFDAMTTDRPYRRAMPPWQALEEIVANSGRQFDPEVVEVFKQVATRHLEAV